MEVALALRKRDRLKRRFQRHILRRRKEDLPTARPAPSSPAATSKSIENKPVEKHITPVPVHSPGRVATLPATNRSVPTNPEHTNVADANDLSLAKTPVYRKVGKHGHHMRFAWIEDGVEPLPNALPFRRALSQLRGKAICVESQLPSGSNRSRPKKCGSTPLVQKTGVLLPPGAKNISINQNTTGNTSTTASPGRRASSQTGGSASGKDADCVNALVIDDAKGQQQLGNQNPRGSNPRHFASARTFHPRRHRQSRCKTFPSRFLRAFGRSDAATI